jgi:hypothetical protein
VNARARYIAALLLAAPAGAHAAGTDTLIAGGQQIAVGGSAANGSTASLDWIRQDENHQLMGLGTSHQEFADARLDIARLTGAFNLTAASSLAGTLEAGAGTTGVAHYRFTRAGLETARVLSKRFTLTGGGQYVEADGARTLLLRAETVWLALAPLTVRAQVSRSVDGNLPARFASVRADYVRRVQLYGGGSIGKGATSVIEFGDVRYERFWGAFVGVAVPVSRCMLGLSWDWLALDTVSRRTATLTVAVLLQRGA